MVYFFVLHTSTLVSPDHKFWVGGGIKENKMVDVTLKDLLAAGCHFGHQVTRWHPKAKRFIYVNRDGIHIIDLAQTRKGLLEACEYIEKTVAGGGKVVFVGTKRQAQGVVKEAAERVGAPFISTRWPGGLLTNWDVIYKNLEKMKDLAERIKNEELRKSYTKKELSLWDKEYAKLTRLYGGVADLTKIPEAVFIVDTHKENGAVREAVKTGVTVIGITDTNANPDLIDYPIPANDDAVGSIKLIVEKLSEAYDTGVKAQKVLQEENEKDKVVKEKPKEVEKKTDKEKETKTKTKMKPSELKKTKKPSTKSEQK